MPDNRKNIIENRLSKLVRTALLGASIITLSGCFGVESDNEIIENAGGNTEVPAPDVTPEPENNAPVITSTSVDAVTSGSEYSYTFTATDTDSDDLTMSSSTLPSWLTFDTTTGILTGTAGDAGTQDITLSVTDGTVTVDQTFTITVSDVVVENAAAVITSTAVLDATAGVVYTYTLTATDADNDVVTLYATTFPSWLSFDEATGVLSGTPTERDLGDHTIFLMASDGSDETEQSFTITVKAPTDVPEPPAGNLISNGTFEDATGWTAIAQNGDTVGDDMVTIANGVVTFSETSNDPWQHAAIYTAVELSVGSYQFDMDMSIDGIANAWGEVYIGASEPVDGVEYNGDLGKVLNGYNAWDCGTDSYSGAATASGCDTANNGLFEITTAGTYYVLFRAGGETFGPTGVVLDNWSITEAEVVIIANGTFEDASGWTAIAQNGDTIGDDVVTIADGAVTFSETSNDPWQHAAIYTAVELSVGSYQFDMDMSIDGIANAWGEVYIGATEPVDGVEYSGDLGKVLNGYNAWDCGTDSYSGAATASGCDAADNGLFEITTAGTYYVLFRSGGETLGLTGVVLDNWSITEAESAIIANGAFEDATGWTAIAQNGDTAGDDMVTIANGVVTFSETSNDPWQQAAIYTSVELSVGSYQFDMDMSIDGIANAWGELYIGATEPVDGAEYNGDLGKVLTGYNAWDCGTDSYSGAATASGCDTADNGLFEITTAGTYYVLFRSGGETLGLTGVVLDNWTLSSVE